MDLGERGSGGKLGGVEGEENVIGICCMREEYFQLKIFLK